MPFFVQNPKNSTFLDFKPSHSTPLGLATFFWKNTQLNHSQYAETPKVDLSDLPLNDVLSQLFGPLTLIETYNLLRACQKNENLGPHINWPDYFKSHNRFWSEKVSTLFDQFDNCPQEFLCWCNDKKLENKDLLPLLALKTEDHWVEFQILAPCWQEQNLSRSDGRMILDLVVDLILMGKKADELFPQNLKSWTGQLQSIRNPMTAQRDDNYELGQWPQFVKVKKQRQGDVLTQMMEITFLNKEDLQSKLKRLIDRSQGQ